MEFDWINSPAGLGDLTPREVEETFEDPFSIRLLPELDDSSDARYFILGRAVSGKLLFTVFWTDGKRYRIIQSRVMTEAEAGFYERKNAELNN
ncbi:hypothetical protein DB345_04820 [Spartobacteria bacterium LR76]|nr:hypothetical protein DB345_04820 [Spartobacteria bacterium LR76]